jgi:FMN phosphatase YigB (HAD superfamily)
VTFGFFGTLVEGCVSSGGIQLFDDVEPMLSELRRLGYRLAVLTNCDDGPFERAHGSFQHPFDLFVTAERIRSRKPSPWHFRAFELMTRVERHDWVHVASSWYHDIAPATAFGLSSVWLDRAPTEHGAGTRVATALEAVEAVAGLFDRAGAEIGA